MHGFCTGSLIYEPGLCALLGASCILTIMSIHVISFNDANGDMLPYTMTGLVNDMFLLVPSYAMINKPTARSSGNMYGMIIGF